MSVWKAREYWDAPRGQDGSSMESVPGLADDLGVRCSRGCLCTVRLPENPESDVILAGTWSGILRGFYPDKTPYNPEQLLFEKVFDAPILQLEVGNFIMGSSTSGSNGFQLAVLHPEKLSMFYYSSGKSDTTSTDLFPLRSYKLKASAYAMVTGTFGGIKGRQMLCVSTMDGRLTLIDQETVMETPVLDDFLLPGPVCYLPNRDSFAVASSNWVVDCYTYSELASRAGMAASQPASTVRIRKAWTYNCGEAVVDIRCTPEAQKGLVLLLGERHLFCLEPNGAMRAIRRLDYCASVVSVYPSVIDVPFNMIVASTAQTLYVYEDLVPKWTTQLPNPVVDIKVCKIASGEGIVVTLAEDGQVTAWYLGTDPEIYEVKAVTTTRKFDEEELRNEITRLTDLIRQSESGPSELKPIMPVAHQALVEVSVQEFSPVSFVFDPKNAASQRSPTARSKVIVGPMGEIISDVSILFQMEPPFIANPSEVLLGVLNKSASVDFAVFNTLSTPPRDVTGNVVVQFTIGESVHVHQETFRLPFTLVAQALPLTKKAYLKLDFEVGPTPLRLPDIFPDFGEHADEAGISMDFYGIGAATLLISKKQESKVRMQSDHPGLLLVVCEEALRRMSIMHPESSFSCASNLPAPYLQDVLQQKAQLTKSYQQQKLSLDAWTKQLFVVEKRFLTRLKDRDVEVVHKLEELLEATQEQIINTLQELETAQANLENVKRAVASTISLIHWLIKLHNQKQTVDEKRILELVVHARSDDSDDSQSWEAQVNEAVSYYMTNLLAGEKTDKIHRGSEDFSAPADLLKRAYLSQVTTGKTKREPRKAQEAVL